MNETATSQLLVPRSRFLLRPSLACIYVTLC